MTIEDNPAVVLVRYDDGALLGRLVLQRHWEEAQEIPIPRGEGGHGGGDGIRAASIGIAANRAIETGAPVRL